MKKRWRISGFGAAGLISAAVGVDLLKIILFPIGLMVAFIGFMAFYFVYKFVFNVSLMEKVVVRVAVSALLQAVPLFGTTLATALTIWSVRHDDRAYNKEQGHA